MNRAPPPVPMLISTSTIETGLTAVQPITWSPDSRYFAILGSNGTGSERASFVLVYEADTQRLAKTLPVKRLGSALGDIAFSPNGKYLVGGTGALTVWNVSTWEVAREILGPFERGEYASGGIDSIALSPDNVSVAVLYRSVTFPESVRVSTHEDSIAVSRGTLKDQGGEIARPSQALMSFDLQTTKRQFLYRMFDSMPGHAGYMTANIAYTPDGKYLLSSRIEFHGTADLDDKQYSFLELRDSATGAIVRQVASPHVMGVTALAVNHLGNRIGTGTDTTNKINTRNSQTGQWHLTTNDDPIRIWNVEDGSKVLELGPLRGAVRSLAFSADDRFLIAAQTDLTAHETIWIWDLKSGEVLERLKTPLSAFDFLHVAISPDGRYIAMPVINTVYLFKVLL